MSLKSWNSYCDLRDEFIRDPSVANEALVVAAYSEWARQFCPSDVEETINLFIRRCAEMVEIAAARR